MSAASAPDTYSLDSVRTINQNVNLQSEPFVVVNADDVVVFSGWMYDARTNRAPRVFARVQRAEIPATSLRRDDLVAPYGRDALHAGFAVAVAIGAFRERSIDIELVCEDAGGGRRPFDRRHLVVFDGAQVERSAAIVIERCHDLGAVLGVEGWAFAAATDGTKYDAAAVVVRERVYQATYGIARDRGAGDVHNGIGLFAQVPTLRLATGTFEIRARLYTANGASLESIRDHRIQIDRSSP